MHSWQKLGKVIESRKIHLAGMWNVQRTGKMHGNIWS